MGFGCSRTQACPLDGGGAMGQRIQILTVATHVTAFPTFAVESLSGMTPTALLSGPLGVPPQLAATAVDGNLLLPKRTSPVTRIVATTTTDLHSHIPIWFKIIRTQCRIRIRSVIPILWLTTTIRLITHTPSRIHTQLLTTTIPWRTRTACRTPMISRTIIPFLIVRKPRIETATEAQIGQCGQAVRQTVRHVQQAIRATRILAPRVQLPPRRAVQATRERKAGLQALTAPKRRPGKARRIRAAIRGLRVIMVPRRLQQQAPAQERRRSTHPRRDLGAARLMTSILTQNPSR